MDQVCINNVEWLTSIVGFVVMGASALANAVPAPDKISNPFLRFLSRALHFVAIDIVTAKKT